MKHKTVFPVCLVVFLALTNLAPFLIKPVNAVAENWATTFLNYRQSHIITNSTGADVSYPICITIRNGSGSSSDYTMYENNRMRSDFGDVLFYANDNTTALDYWCTNITSGVSATFWVEMPSSATYGNLTSTNQQIWVYYGNSTMTTASNGTNTFLLFDSMENFPTNPAWTSNSMTKNTTVYYDTVASAKMTVDNASYFTRAADKSVCGWVRLESENDADVAQLLTLWDGTNTRIAQAAIHRSGATYYWAMKSFIAAWVTTDSTSTASLSTWYFVELLQSGATFFLKINGAEVLNKTLAATPASTLTCMGRMGNGVPTAIAYFDDFLVRKYVNPEPVHSTWGAEEVYVPTSASHSETRYMRSNIWTVNTKSGYALNTTQTSSIESLPICSEAGDVYKAIFIGINVEKVLSDGTQIAITAAVVAIASSSTSGLLSATWSCPYTDLESTDAIGIHVWADKLNPPTSYICSFYTEQLGANNLSAYTWNVYYYLNREFDGGTTTYSFEFGDPSENSRIENFTWNYGNSAPTIGSVSGTNWDDTDNLYAQKKSYKCAVTYTDPDGYADIHYVEMYLQSSGNVTRACFRYHEDDNTVSTPTGGTAWTLDSLVADFVRSGTSIVSSWNFTAQWDATEESDCDFLFYVIDASGEAASSTSDQNFDVVTRLVTSGLASDDPKINIGGTTTISGIVYYANAPGSNTASTSYPPDTEFTSVSIHDSAHAVQGSNTTIVNGAFSVSFAIPSVVQTNTYHVYLNMADADYTDADAPDGDTTAVIGDRLQIQSYTVADDRVNINDNVNIDVLVWFDFDDTVCTTGTITINGFAAAHQGGGVYRITKTWAVATIVTYNTVACSAETTFGITTVDQNGKSKAVTWDSLTITIIGPADQRINIGENASGIFVSAVYDSDGVTPFDGTFTLNDTTYDYGTVGKRDYNVSSVAGDTYGITAIKTNDDTYCIWDALQAFNLQPVSYLGSGNYEYQAQIEYGSDLSTINGATVGLVCGTSSYSTVSNVTGWAVFILGQGNATSGVWSIYGLDDNNYGITVTLVNMTFSLYNWTLTTQDVSGITLTNTTTAVSASGISVWSGNSSVYVPPDTFNLTVSWLQNLIVNVTENVPVAADSSLNLTCLAYPYTVSGTSHWAASNSTITSETYVASVLQLGFNGTVGTYSLVTDCPAYPTYLLNVTYDYAADFSVGYLVLSHWGNATITVSYEAWGLHIQKTTHRLTSIAFSSYTMTMTITGNTAEIGSLELYCGGWGTPASSGGFVVTSYAPATKVFTGTYTFSSTVLATITWSGGSGPGGGGVTGEVGLPLLLDAVLDLPQFAFQNNQLNGTVTVSWQGIMIQVYFAGIKTLASDANYTVSVPAGLPYTLKLSYNGSNLDVVPFILYVPLDASVGEHQIPFSVELTTTGAQTRTFRLVAYVTVQQAAQAVSLPGPSDLIIVLFVAMFAGLIMPIIFRTQKARAQRSRSL